MPGYLARKLTAGTFEVSRWDDSSRPTEVYTLKEGPRGWQCSCPSRKATCKHVAVIKWRTALTATAVPERMLELE